MITFCRACQPVPGGGRPAIASALWRFVYKSGAERDALVCAACGFAQLARPAVKTASLNVPEGAGAATRRRRMGAEEATLRAQARELRALLKAYAKNP